MNTESLARALNSLPSENFEFSEVSFNENPDDTDSLDSMGSCCNSPNQSSDGSMSPPPSKSSCDDDYFVFPDDGEGGKDSDIKIKRKLECKVKRNERERRRVRRLADGFRKLREVVPGNYKKLSKLDTLRRALDYISSISELIETHDSGSFDNGMNFIKQERIRFPQDYPSCSPPSYHPNTIAYQPVPEWRMYEQKIHSPPTFQSSYADHQPYYPPHNVAQRPPQMMFPFQQYNA